MRGSHAVLSLAIFLVASVTVQPQETGAAKAPPRSVLVNYDAGVNAIKAQQWQDAIAPLTSAMAADPNPRRYREGVALNDYFPQLYLFEAYVKLGDFVNANKFYNIRGPVSPTLLSQMKPFADALITENARAAKENADRAMAIAARAAADKAAADKAIADKAAADRAAAARAAADKAAADRAAADRAAFFETIVKNADAAYVQRNYADAVTGYTNAKNRFPEEFNRRNLQAKLDSATSELKKIGADAAKKAQALPRSSSATADRITWSGNVTFVVNGITLRADEAVYDKGTRALTLKGNVTAMLPEGVALPAK